MLSFFPRGVLDEILNLIESVSEGFPSYSWKYKLVQMIITTTQCVANKNHVARPEIKVTVCTETLCIGFSETCSSPIYKFVMHNWI